MNTICELIIKCVYRLQISYWKLLWILKRSPIINISKLDTSKLYTPLQGFYSGHESTVFWQLENYVMLFFPLDNTIHSYGYDEITEF